MAKKTALVCGYGPGISSAVAERLGSEGFAVALAARSAERLEAGVKALREKNIEAAAFPTDLGDPDAVRALVEKARGALGPITILHWNAYTHVAGDLTTADSAELKRILDVPVVGLVAAVQAALPDLRAAKKDSAILVTNGGLGNFDERADAIAVQWGAMGLAIGASAKHKAVRLLAKKLEGEVYVGEVIVLGTVKGTAFDQGNATLAPEKIAERFWAMVRERREVSTSIS